MIDAVAMYVVYPAWLVTFLLGFYSAGVATERWGFAGRLAAYVIWVFGNLLGVFGTVLLLHKHVGDTWSFLIGFIVGIEFNVAFFLAGLRLKFAHRKAWEKRWQQFNDEADRG